MTGQNDDVSRYPQCSFCDKSQKQVECLIGGPRGVAICNECIALST